MWADLIAFEVLSMPGKMYQCNETLTNAWKLPRTVIPCFYIYFFF